MRLYREARAHPRKDGTASVTDFAVWALNAEQVCVMGDFNGWSKTSHPLESQGESGIWENTVPNVVSGTL